MRFQLTEINWTRSDSPLLVWEGERGYVEAEDRNSWYGGHQRPSLMFEDGIWKMWFDYKENQIGYAECSGDFLTGEWTEVRGGNQPLLSGVDFDVVKIGSVYYAYGDPYIDWYKIQDDEIPYYSDDSNRWSQRQIVEISVAGRHNLGRLRAGSGRTAGMTPIRYPRYFWTIRKIGYAYFMLLREASGKALPMTGAGII